MASASGLLEPSYGNSCRYFTSPSLPQGIQKRIGEIRFKEQRRNSVHKTGTTSLPQLQSSYLSSCLSSTKYTSAVELNDRTFSDTLSSIGPSARALLQLDEEQKNAQKESYLSQDKHPVVKTSPRLSKKKSKAKAREIALNNTEGETDTIPNSEKEEKLRKTDSTPMQDTATLSGTLMRRSRRDIQNLLRDPEDFQATYRQSSEDPAIVSSLYAYLDRELRLSCGTVQPTSMTALGPYREVLSALIASFPGYGKLLCDIQSAYDNVLQYQSELLADAFAKEMENHDAAHQYEEDVAHLRSIIQQIEADLHIMQEEKARRDEEAAKTAQQYHNLGNSRADNIELRKHLDVATLRVEELETMTRQDSEKILVLIGAVRECDKRLKAYEIKVNNMSGQVAELNEFQRLAAEAQSELQKYKHKFRSYVSAEDFELMRNHLTQELASSQKLSRKLRRTATVRGTQVDVLLRKLQQLESDQEALLEGSGSTAPLTPRPNWKKLYEEVPELHEFSKPIHNDPLVQLSNHPMQSPIADERPSDDAEHLVVEGPTATALHIDFLVQMVRSLQEKMKVVEEEKEAVVERARKDHVMLINQRASEAGGPSVARSGTSRSHTSGSRGRQQESFSQLEIEGPPMIGPGVGDQVPAHIRCVGIVDRKPIPLACSIKLIFGFFLEELLPSLELEETQAISRYDVKVQFLQFLEKKMMEEKKLSSYPYAPHIALNLMEDAKDPFLRSPALVLLANILYDTMPVRLALDTSILISRVIKDLNAIAKEQQKSRLRRNAIAETLLPILELKTPEDLTELRSTLGTEASFDLFVLVSIENRFLTTMFCQQCQQSMDFYVKLIKALTLRSSELQENLGDRCITLKDIEEAIYETDGNTPEVVVREITENSTRKAEEGNCEDFLRLSEVIEVLDVSPVFLRTPQSSKEECIL